MLPITIREAELADAQRLLDIERISFITDLIPLRQMRYLISQAKAITYVAEYEGRVIGYVMVLVPKHPRPARIYSIAVDPAQRGQKVAQRLMHIALGYLRSLQYAVVRLEVRADDEGAQTLYRQFGFTPIRHMAQYYADGAAALKMQLTLEVPSPSE